MLLTVHLLPSRKLKSGPLHLLPRRAFFFPSAGSGGQHHLRERGGMANVLAQTHPIAIDVDAVTYAHP